jgi:hypothetical protein
MQVVGARVAGGSGYSLGVSAGVATNQLVLAPVALFTALFRPSLLDVTTPLILVTALEMTVFTIAALLVPFRLGIPAALSHIMRSPFLGFCAMFVLVFGTCVGLATTNLGTLSRYRMPLMPFFAILLVSLLTRKRDEAAADRKNPLPPKVRPIRVRPAPLRSG